MGLSLETFIENTQNVTSTAVLKKLFLSAVAEEGYENAVFAQANNRRLVSIPWSEFPAGYLDTYKAEEWDRIDPVVQRAPSARGLFKWSDTGVGGGFTKKQKTFFEQCRELGVHSGITIPIRGMGHGVDLISLSLRTPDKLAPDRMTYVYMLSVQYWLKYCGLVGRQDEQTIALTSQERECLRWCKEGKTNWEIGEILSISEKTVEFHLSNGMRKLGASNRITAVIIGIKWGLIPL
ncbi:helix-turn-helix transcriptional regulator [Bradyrhizobium brasilense]|uniref:LuxR C-terminal-related transcriptional regulator n=1 Tax=Bradyrhizobium brasilense TaxID=1419277 RepID=A0ABY8JFD4_9BRAD|nr:LuxR family transcriptional regulator [Bradyrhizobium brasilense]WFU62668.1 LuxR C-terminal-related transcriptional regulator [Bradyrhizobium brasilense]